MGGIFGFFDYNKPGKGVEKNAPQKPRWMLFFELYGRKFWKLIQLNLLFLLFCLPVLTIVPAWTAMIKITTNYALERPVFLYTDFLAAFRENFRKSFVTGVLFGGVVMVQLISVQVYWKAIATSPFFYLPMLIVLSLIFVMLFSFAYLSVMIPLLDMKLKPMIQNALRLTILGVKGNLMLGAVTLLLAGVIISFFPFTLFFVLLLYGSTMAFVTSFLCYPEIEKRIITPYYETTQQERPDALYHRSFESSAVGQDESAKHEETPVSSD